MKSYWLPSFAVVALVGLAVLASRSNLPESVAAAPTPTPSTVPSPSPAPSKVSLPLVPGKNDSRITSIVAEMLSKGHFSQVPLNDEVSKKALDNFLLVLDYNHLVFLQSDIDEFNRKYATQIDDLTEAGKADPAYEIFARFLSRLEARTELVSRLLKEKYDFTTDEFITLGRDKGPWPKDEAEAESLWRARIKSEFLHGKLNKEKPEKTLSIIDKRYARSLRSMREVDADELLGLYLTAIAHAYDPHSDFFTKKEAESFEISNIKMALTGIGAVLRSEDGIAKIVSVVPGGPADLDKRLKPNDKILAVAQEGQPPVDVVDMKLDKVVEKIRGKAKTKVTLTIVPADAPDDSVRKEIVIVRDEVKLKDQLAKAQIIDHPTGNGKTQRVGVIQLPQFYKGTAEHIATLLRRLMKENVAGVVLDMRRNGGGLLEEAVDLTGLFVKGGPVVQVKSPGGTKPQVLKCDSSAPIYTGPLVVVVDRLSASATEIVAGALQDYGRAVVVGDTSTHGKGTVQQLVPLSRFWGWGLGEGERPAEQLKLTVQKFYRISGGSTQKKGVVPDIILPSPWDHADIGESTLPNCLPYDVIEKADYPMVNNYAPILPELLKRSQERVKQDIDFSYIMEDSSFRQKKLEEKKLSLNEATRRAEKEALLKQLETRKKERTARLEPKDHIWELSLDAARNADPLKDTSATPTPTPTKLPTDEGENDPVDDSSARDAQLDESINILVDLTLLQPSGMLQTNPVATK